MKVVGLISILFLFLAFKLAHAQSCITNYNSAVYRIETNATTISIKTTQSLATTSPSTTTNTLIPWKAESETQQGVTSLFSCTTVHQYAFLLITPSIRELPNGNRNVADDVRIVTYNYESRRWRLVPLDLRLVMHPWTLVSFAWHQEYIVYNTQRKRAYYFDTQHWSWYSYDDDDQQPFLRPPSSTTTPEITVVGNTMYYLYSDGTDPHSNHIYMFDIPAAKWKGHFASFWSNTSSFVLSSSRPNNALYVIPRSNNFKDRFMRKISLDLIPKGLLIQTPTVDLPNRGTLVTERIIVDSSDQDEGDGLIFYNETTLVFYQPSNNTVTAIYGEIFGGTPNPGVGATTFPDPPPDPPPFWSTTEGQRTKVALSCSLSLGMVIAALIGVVVLQRRRRQRQGQLELARAEVENHQEERSSHQENEQENEKTNSPQEEVTTTVTETTMTASPPSMQSLSFLSRDNAMVWGKNVHQLLALIAFHHHQAGDQSPANLSRSSSEYPSMIETSTTISALAKSSMILSIMSTSSYSNSANSFQIPLHGTEPATPIQCRSLDMACPLPRTTLDPGEAASHTHPDP